MMQILHDLRIAWASAMAAMGSGTATVMEWIPTDIGKLVSLAGGILTIVLIRLHWRNGNASYDQILIDRENALLDREKTRLEIAALKEKTS